MNFSQVWSIAALRKKASTIGAGPLMVIETLVVAEQRSNPLYSFFASSRQQILTPAFPILPYMSGRSAGSFPYRVTESKAVESLFAGMPKET